MSSKDNTENIFKNICDYPVPTYDEWKAAVEKALKGAPFTKLVTRTYEEIILQPMYQKKDVEHLSFPKSLPGKFPYVRGTNRIDEKGHWLVAQEMDHPLPEILNEWLKNDLQRGVNAIHLVLNEEIKQGRVPETHADRGATISSVEDLAVVLKDLDASDFPFIIQCGANINVLSLLVAYFKKNNIPLTNLKGYVGLDPLAILVKEGTLQNNLDFYLNQMAEQIKWKIENKLDIKTIFIDSSPYHNGGANGVQELGFMVATGTFYIRELLKRGLSIDEIASSICFSISIGSNLFMELAKIRGVKMLWANVVAAFGGNEESQKIVLHARTSHWTKTVYDPYVNMLRGTIEAFTAAVGGVESLHVSPFDEAINLSNDFSRRIARNIQLIIQEEVHVTKTQDPAGGSWYIEHLTDEITNKSWELFQLVEAEGGIWSALEKGISQRFVNDVSLKKKADIEKRKLVFVGATMYPNSNEVYNRRIDQGLLKAINERFQILSLNKQEPIVVNSNILMSNLIEAFIGGASLPSSHHLDEKGISIEPIKTFRATESFELLRQYSEQKKASGEPLNVFLTSIGTLAEHKQRTDFISSFFETGGFEVLKSNGYINISEAINDTINTQASIAVICGKNESYAEHAIQIVTEVKKARPDIRLFVAGKQEDELVEQLLAAGLTGFIHVGTNCYQLLKQLQGEKEGASGE